MRYKFRVKSVVVFYQDTAYLADLHRFQKWIGAGYVYTRNDHISELRVEGHAQVGQLLIKLKPYLQFKSKHASYMLQALQLMSGKTSIDNFLSVCDLADEISMASYVSRNRKYTAGYVRKILSENNLIPVTTGLPK